MKLNFLLLVLMATIYSNIANAGLRDGGGGKGVVCRTPTGKVQSVELLDLWEFQEVYGQPVKRSTSPLRAQIIKAIESLKYSTQSEIYDQTPGFLENFLQKTADKFLNNSKDVYRRHNITLVSTDDSLEVAIPNGNCKIEQIVNYIDSSAAPKILINQDLVEKMSSTDQAALYLHEALYLFLRGKSDLSEFDNYVEPNSVRVRRAIGYVMAGNQFPSLEKILGRVPRYTVCNAGIEAGKPSAYTEFYLYPDKDGGSHAILVQKFGKRMLGFFPETFVTGMPYDFFEQKNACPDASQAANRTPSHDVYRIPGSGPVDYQSMTWIGFGCEFGKSVWLVRPDPLETEFKESQLLYCRYVDNKH